MGQPILKSAVKKERVWLTGIRRSGQTIRDFEASLQELNRLVDTAGGLVIGESHQMVDPPNPKTFIGKGKVCEIHEKIRGSQIDSVAIDDELTPTQNQNLEQAWGVKVLDRTAVILDIFAKRAQTKEGRLQVELAQLQYMQPRLKGMWSHFSKQTGGIGTRGPGETQLEVDRRRIKEKIAHLRERLKEVERHRALHRSQRESVPLPVISLVGYTNAGKSTLFNALTKASTFVEDKLFATLDPTVRKLKLPTGRQVLLADTVGFIRNLPHSLVEAFKATFEEVSHADLILHIVDSSDPEVFQQIETVVEVMSEMQLLNKPSLMVLNKIDCGLRSLNGCHGIPVSALSGEGLTQILEEIDLRLRQHCRQETFFIPHSRNEILSQLYKLAHVLHVEHQAEGTEIFCELPASTHQKYIAFKK